MVTLLTWSVEVFEHEAAQLSIRKPQLIGDPYQRVCCNVTLTVRLGMFTLCFIKHANDMTAFAPILGIFLTYKRCQVYLTCLPRGTVSASGLKV